MNQMSSKRYRIGEVSKITGLPVSRLRYYDKIGILSPRWRDEGSEYRLYDAYQLVEAYTIEQYQYFGFSLSQIQLLLNNPTSFFDNANNICLERLNELDEEITKLKRIRLKLERMQKFNAQQLCEFQCADYVLEPMKPCTYIMSDLRADISYSSHFAKAINKQVEMYAIDRKLPWYYCDEFYQISLKNAETNTVGRFCIRIASEQIFESPLTLYRDTSPYCIKFMDTIEIENIPNHINKMLQIASDSDYSPSSGYYYLGELAMEAPSKNESAVRQIIIPLRKK